MNTRKLSIISYLVSALALLVIILTLSNAGLPFFSDYKGAFIVLWILGLFMSMLAGIRDNPEGKIIVNKYVMMSLMILGLLTLPLLVIVVLDIPIAQASDLFLILVAIIILKWVITHSYILIKKQ
jgi:uncharacterized membrane protein YiaA